MERAQLGPGTPVARAVGELRRALQADGADLLVRTVDEESVSVDLVITDEACAECILPAEVLESIVEQTLVRYGAAVTSVRLHDPRRPDGGAPASPRAAG